MPKSFTSTPSGSGRSASRRTTSTPKPSSPRKMLPMPAIRTRSGLMRRLQIQGLDLFGGEEEPVPEEAAFPQIPPRVVLEGHGDVYPALVILLYALDERDLSLEGEVHDVPPGTGPEQDAATLLEIHAAHGHALERGPLLVFPAEVLHPSPATSRHPRQPPSAPH